MAGNQLVKASFPFVGQTSIACQHNVGGPVNVAVVIDGDSRPDLTSSIVIDPVDPNNRLTVNLESAQTGSVVVYEGDVLPSFAPSPTESAALSEAFSGPNPPSQGNPYATQSDVSAHADSTTNPHSTTAAQVGAPTAAAFNTHIGLSNPHGTSATDVGAIQVTEKGAVNGVATLGATGKVPSAQLDISGIPAFQGTWDANTNTPTLASSTGTAGHFYKVTVAGTTTLDGISSWAVGDEAIFNGSVWQKIPGASAVSSVNGQTGVVTLDTDDISEGSTNEYFTEVRANAASDVVLNTTHRGRTDNPHSVDKSQVGLGNVENVKVNLSAGVDPTENDDTGAGYSVGSVWINTTSDPPKVWVCGDASTGAAEWLQTTGEIAASRYFDGYDAVGGTVFGTGGSWTDIPITTVRKQDSDAFNHSGSSPEVEILVTGSFEVDYQVTCDQTAGNNRATGQSRLLVDTGAGFSVVPGSFSSMYSRNTTDSESTAAFSGILDLNAGDKLKVQVANTTGSETLVTLAQGCRLTIGLHKGQKGDPGPSGSGSVVVEDSGLVVSGGPFTTLNFNGNLTAVDQGAGRVQVSASASGSEDPGQGFSDVEHFFFLDPNKWTIIGSGAILAGGIGGQLRLTGPGGGGQSRIESVNTPILMNSSLPRVKFRIRKGGTLADSIELGFRSSTTNEVNIQVQTGSNWFGQCLASGVGTSIDLGVSGVTSNWQTLELVYTGSAVEFYIDEVLRGTISTNIPTTDLFVYCWVAGDLDADIDYIWTRMDLEV